MDKGARADVLATAARIVAAHVAHNPIEVDGLAPLLRDVLQSLRRVGANGAGAAHVPPVPAVPIRKSVLADHIICLEDGRKLKSLRRHLKVAYGMTPDQYRARWGLSATYPMVAPEYARQRSELAKRIGLGTAGQRATRAASEDAIPAVAVTD